MQLKLHNSVPPVFICGFPKSGTTLLLSLLDRHPNLLVFPEESRFLKLAAGDLSHQSVDYLLEHTGANSFSYDKVQWSSGCRDYSSIDYNEYKRLVSQIYRQSDRSPKRYLEAIVWAYGLVTEQTENASFWVEKTPGNEKHLSMAASMWPDLKAIYIARSPLQNFHSYRLKRYRGGKTLTPEEFVDAWRQSVECWQEFAAGNANCLSIQYNDLVTAPRQALDSICDFLSIPWDNCLTQPTRNGHHWSGNSMHSQTFTGISTASLERFRTELSAEEIDYISTQLADHMTEFCGESNSSVAKKTA